MKFKFEEDLKFDFYFDNKKIEKFKTSPFFLNEDFKNLELFHQKQFLELKKENPYLNFYDYILIYKTKFGNNWKI